MVLFTRIENVGASLLFRREKERCLSVAKPQDSD